MKLIEEYYNNRDEESRLSSLHGQVEYLTTMKYIHECIGNIKNPKIIRAEKVSDYLSNLLI